MKIIGELFLLMLFAGWVRGCALEPPKDLDRTHTNYTKIKLNVEEDILKSEIQDIDYRLRNELYSSKTPGDEKTELIVKLKQKKDQLDRNIWEEELRRRNEK